MERDQRCGSILSVLKSWTVQKGYLRDSSESHVGSWLMAHDLACKMHNLEILAKCNGQNEVCDEFAGRDSLVRSYSPQMVCMAQLNGCLRLRAKFGSYRALKCNFGEV